MATFFFPKTFAIIIFFISSFLRASARVRSYDPFASGNHHCYEEVGTYDSLTSDYGTNIDNALTRLTTMASTTYYNTYTTGLGQDQVYALFSCSYDRSLLVCQSCVAGASKKIKSRCLDSVEAIIWYQDCTLRYANFTIFSLEEHDPTYYVYIDKTVDDNGRFSQLLDSTVTSLIDDVTSGYNASSRYFAKRKAKYSSYKMISTLAQCNPDIKPSECSNCLQTDFSSFKSKYTGVVEGQMYSPSCSLRYKLSFSLVQSGASSSSPLTGTRGSSLYGSIIGSTSLVVLPLMLLLI